ncbi:hypothetical protein [Candidatus Odyssella acanthamoebae]|uniref:Uncharacterized protein n=1 Tax=Candidatus Odyssella acanthamoebae TaxID=91604 RepID=A0A077AUI3_9PROT|nr:hypothetical protein [Candidatus Paracaedibacter acanthamoebae]AIK96041.1 hypothetical protein ID47_03720 [Candidatus Paracaedibacter acanthamoebae]
MITRTIIKQYLIRTSDDILYCMEAGILPCFYESQLAMNDFIIQQFDFFVSKLILANQDPSSFQVL